MRVSLSLRGEDVEFLDAYANAHVLPSRSAVVREAINLLRRVDLSRDYADAWDEWQQSGDAGLWETTA